MYVHLLGKGTYKTRMSKQFRDESFADEAGPVQVYTGSPADIRKVIKVLEKYYGQHDRHTSAQTNWSFECAVLMDYPVTLITDLYSTDEYEVYV